jgi:DNA-binding NtrC family response regulator
LRFRVNLPRRIAGASTGSLGAGLGNTSMKHPQVVVYETDGRLAQLLRERVRASRWAMREPRQRESCLALLRDASPTVFVLKTGSKLETELGILQRVHTLLPDARSVVVGDLQNTMLADLAWDMGASFVLFPPLPHGWLPEIVVQLMQAAIASGKTEGEIPAETAESQRSPDEGADD